MAAGDGRGGGPRVPTVPDRDGSKGVSLLEVVREIGVLVAALAGSVLLAKRSQDRAIREAMRTRAYRLKWIAPPASSPPRSGGAGGTASASGPDLRASFPLYGRIAGLLSPSGTLAFDRDSNSFMVTDLPERHDGVAKAFAAADRRPAQVMVGVKLVVPAVAAARDPASGRAGGQDPGEQGFTILNFQETIRLLKASQSSEGARILEVPKVVLVSGGTAEVFLGGTWRSHQPAAIPVGTPSLQVRASVVPGSREVTAWVWGPDGPGQGIDGPPRPLLAKASIQSGQTILLGPISVNGRDASGLVTLDALSDAGQDD